MFFTTYGVKKDMIFPRLKIEVERWKFNKEYNIYVSNLGNIRDKTGKEIKKRVESKKGYMTIVIDKIHLVRVHRLVAEMWCENDDPEHKTTIDHLDHNKRNNRASNLEWVSEKENKDRAKEDFIVTPEEMEARIASLERANKSLSMECKNLKKKQEKYVKVNDKPITKDEFNIIAHALGVPVGQGLYNKIDLLVRGKSNGPTYKYLGIEFQRIGG